MWYYVSAKNLASASSETLKQFINVKWYQLMNENTCVFSSSIL
jgi:hypothetical protein